MDSVIARGEYEENIISFIKKIPSSEEKTVQNRHKKISLQKNVGVQRQIVPEEENPTQLRICRETMLQLNLKSRVAVSREKVE